MTVYKGNKKVGVTIIKSDPSVIGFIDGTGTSFEIPQGTTRIRSYCFYKSPLVEISVPSSVETFASYSFQNSEALKNVRLNDGLLSIGSNAFNNCKKLETINIPNTVTDIKTNAFGGCESLKEIHISDNITSLSDNVFQVCKSLKSVVIPDSVTSIQRAAFYQCTSLESVVFSKNIPGINDSTFYGCTALKELNIPDKVEYFDYKCFYNCTGLQKITLGKNFKAFYDNVLTNCSNLVKVIFSEEMTSVPTRYANSFTNINVNCKFYVPDALYDAWIVDPNWVNDADKIVKLSEMPTE